MNLWHTRRNMANRHQLHQLVDQISDQDLELAASFLSRIAGGQEKSLGRVGVVEFREGGELTGTMGGIGRVGRTFERYPAPQPFHNTDRAVGAGFRAIGPMKEWNIAYIEGRKFVQEKQTSIQGFLVHSEDTWEAAPEASKVILNQRFHTELDSFEHTVTLTAKQQDESGGR